ncbi:hypothetical protein Pla110_24810 [Polystyrenella longa]|uniref:Uncharacterized protein n=1 Tax=Polystyrenella longa TaxID=2528007 RepID=A0A518CNF8_9PLAN|nr:hypothetical protein Pla110_24810 [Polystyrenella longa]
MFRRCLRHLGHAGDELVIELYKCPGVFILGILEGMLKRAESSSSMNSGAALMEFRAGVLPPMSASPERSS